MTELKVFGLTDDGGLIINGLNGDSYRFKPDEADSFGLTTGELYKQIRDLNSTNLVAGQVLIDRLRSEERQEALANKECPFPGQRMLASNTIIYRRK